MLGNKEIMAENIKRYMREKGMRSIDVCAAIDVPKTTFSGWLHEASYPRIDKIERMAKLFGCTKADLVEAQSTVLKQYDLSVDEYALVEGYRHTDEQTKEMVKRLLAYERIVRTIR